MRQAIPVLLTLSLCVGAGTTVGQSAPIYKWVDANGVTVYGSQPPIGSDYQVTGVRAKKTNTQALQARLENQSDLRAAKKVRLDQEAEQAEEEATEQQRIANERAANCDKAREQLESYDSSRRLYRPLPNGEREYLSDEEIDATRADARAQVREWCD